MPPETRDRFSVFLRMLPVLIAAAALAAFFLWPRAPRGPEPSPVVTAPAPDTGGETPVADREPSVRPDESAEAWVDLVGEVPVWPEDFDDPASCSGAIEEIRSLCARLDERLRSQGREVPGGTFVLLEGAASDLEATAPPVEGVLSSLDTVRANVAHVFRVLGRKRIGLLLEIARREPAAAEPLALAASRWLRAAGCPEDAPEPWPRRTQYAYGVFLIRTLGGQALLRRRSPSAEALASFHALVMLDRVIADGHNPQGVDLRPEIERCQELMSGARLVFRDRYRQRLDEMERRWRSPTRLQGPGAP